MKQLEDIMEKEDTAKEKLQIIKRILTPRVILIILAIILVVSPFLYIVMQNHTITDLRNQIAELQKRIEELINNPLVVDPVTPEIVLDIVNVEFGEVDKLSTIEYLFTNSGRFTDSQQLGNWNIPLTEKSFTLRWNGIISAGIHLNDVGYEVKDTTITVSIPAAEIFSYDVDEDSVEVLDEKNNVFNPISVEDKVKFDAESEQFMKERAIECGLLEKAQENAKILIQNLLIRNPQIGTNYEIIFAFADN